MGNIFKLNADTSKVLSQELLDHLLEQFPLGNSGAARPLCSIMEEFWPSRRKLNVVELFAIFRLSERQ